MPVPRPAAVVACGNGDAHLAEFRRLRSLFWSLGRGSFCCHLVLPQMAAGQVYEDVFETGLARAEVFELVALLVDRSEQRGNGEMRFAHVEADCTVLAADGFDAGQRAPRIGFLAVRVAVGLAIHSATDSAIDSELDHVMAAEAVDEVGGSAFGDDLAVIDDGEAVAEAFGLVHVVSGEEDRPTFFLEDADNVPELPAALGIESGGRLVEKKDARIAD